MKRKSVGWVLALLLMACVTSGANAQGASMSVEERLQMLEALLESQTGIAWAKNDPDMEPEYTGMELNITNHRWFSTENMLIAYTEITGEETEVLVFYLFLDGLQPETFDSAMRNFCAACTLWMAIETGNLNLRQDPGAFDYLEQIFDSLMVNVEADWTTGAMWDVPFAAAYSIDPINPYVSFSVGLNP